MKKIRILGLLVLAAAFFQCTTEKSHPPHIVIYLADDLSVDDVGAYGAEVVKTPNLDHLAAEGMRFDRAFIASPACAPSRAALITGLMPARNGAEANHTYPKKGVTPLIDQLKAKGYKVYGFGKVAHGYMNETVGFDYYNDDKRNLDESVAGFFDTVKVDGPVCLFVGDRRPHVQWTKKMDYDVDAVDLPSYFIDTQETREHRSRYYTDVSGFDETMGKVLAFTDSLFGYNTIVALSSDHGAQWPFSKWNLYDDGIRVPFIMRWKGNIPEGTTTDAMVSWVDLLPTVFDMVGFQVSDSLDGKSFKDVAYGKADKFRDFIFTTHTGDGNKNVYPIRSIRSDKYKLIWNLKPDCYHTNHSDLLRKDGAGAYWDSWDEAARNDTKAAAIIKKYYTRPEFEFYELQRDPNEQNNLINSVELAPIVGNMKQQLNEWIEVQGDQLEIHLPNCPTGDDVEILKEIGG